ncbi:MAG: hypothetical protein EWV58_00290 [Microcystis aeruginosa Ma_MB_F_20061100_S19]|uniref:Uncharacterized protein n=2 Tax=Microcystis aeruginosa TaxID=1126 RepID=S3J0J2_MICAE|nr:hypothetical protein [Microcystis aeruginosa]NCR98726.1 hypothetical protein [Microcystis aeruginosa L311-01]TRU12624.1 MAG: hypothetical protein EWV59_08265 [Microcystis aeruginosa Ma_MB_F_20061100_S19D]TRU19060.1 MAG: hypothetical protein EWV58_00290 [Microcystis aeruginosa Ma_MB_F_20061100_S19]EPF18276.1 hypothetical protein MAESPC_04550 [Microcystis aeruginosa SPC777]GCE59728.1 hypothetical protein MiAbB_01647 [Microcystis aeruginosa NIES-4285]
MIIGRLIYYILVITIKIVVSILLIALLPIEILIRLIWTLFSLGSVEEAEACWEGFPWLIIGVLEMWTQW